MDLLNFLKENAYLNETFNEERISREIKDKNNTFLIAMLNQKIIGYAKLSKNKISKELNGLCSVELMRLYIIKEMIGKKIGTILMTNVLEIAHTKNYEVIWLSVWEFNPKAIAFYEGFGFESFGEDIFTLGATKRNLVLMKKELS